MTDPTVPVTSGAIHARIQRKLASQNMKLRMNRHPTRVLPGAWYVVEKISDDVSRVVRDYVDLNHAARDLHVLYGHEVIDE